MENSEKWAKECAHLFFRMCYYIEQAENKLQHRQNTREFKCTWLTPDVPALVFYRKAGESYTRFMRLAQSLSMLFVNSPYATPECVLKLHKVTQYEAIIAADVAGEWMDFRDRQTVNDAVRKGLESDLGLGDLAFCSKIPELLPEVSRNHQALYWNDDGEFITADETAADALADLLEALGYDGTTTGELEWSSIGPIPGAWYVTVV